VWAAVAAGRTAILRTIGSEQAGRGDPMPFCIEHITNGSSPAPNPTRLKRLIELDAVDAQRHVFCDQYERCLDSAIKRSWPSWTCKSCRLASPPSSRWEPIRPPAPLPPVIHCPIRKAGCNGFAKCVLRVHASHRAKTPAAPSVGSHWCRVGRGGSDPSAETRRR